MRKITANDVAFATGYSPAAVSRAFRKGSPISNGVREEILVAARDLGYSSPSARSVAAMTRGTITLVTGNLENPFYPMAVAALSQAIHQLGRRMILHAIPPRGDVDTVLEQVLDLKSEAAIVTSTLMSSHIAKACRAQRMPVILFNRVQTDLGMTAVTCDNYGGGRLAAQRFIATGRQDIAMIGGRADTSTHLERTRGFQDALGETDCVVKRVIPGDYQYATSLAAMTELLSVPGAIDAVFCANDIMALAAIDAARNKGVRVPDDVAIIGFDDISMASWPSYNLTTVRQPLNRMVADTLELIDDQLADPGAIGAIRIAPVRLMVRGSC
ncbi:substrate-binding domain-containing protein [Roseovarius aestuarii]|nr:substrate-binding domain-containing protein [Roseovarius aestuarii]